MSVETEADRLIAEVGGYVASATAKMSRLLFQETDGLDRYKDEARARFERAFDHLRAAKGELEGRS